MKILIVGPGKLGGGIAYKLIQLGICELYLYGNDAHKTEGIAYDLGELNILCKITVLRSLQEFQGADYTFFTFSTLKWSSSIQVNDRMIDARNNLEIIRQLAKDTSSEKLGTIIIISNPVDILTRFCHEIFRTDHVFGFGNSLDAIRISNSISLRKITTTSNRLLCIGEHGAGVVPVLSEVIGPEHLTPDLYRELADESFSRTQKIIAQYSIPFYAPLYAIEQLLNVIVNKQNGVCVLSTFLYQPFYNVQDLAIGVPIEFEMGNFRRIAAVDLSEYEQELLFNSAHLLNKSYHSLI